MSKKSIIYPWIRCPNCKKRLSQKKRKVQESLAVEAEEDDLILFNFLQPNRKPRVNKTTISCIMKCLYCKREFRLKVFVRATKNKASAKVIENELILRLEKIE